MLIQYNITVKRNKSEHAAESTSKRKREAAVLQAQKKNEKNRE